MVRDMDLVRDILRAVEEQQKSVVWPGKITMEGRLKSEEELIYHVDLMIESEILKGNVVRWPDGKRDYVIESITWKGHDFLDNSRSESIWKTVKEKIAKSGISVSMDVISMMLKEQVMETLGLSDSTSS